MNEIPKLVTTKPDKEVAAELKDKLVQAYEPLLKVIDECSAAGFKINVQVGTNAFGKAHIQLLVIVKEF